MHSHHYNNLIATAKESRTLDEQTISNFGIDGFTLMETAGKGMADYLSTRHDSGTHGLYLCGKGNNCGDALVVARYLFHEGCAATILFVSGSDELSKDAAQNQRLLEQIQAQHKEGDRIQFVEGWEPEQLGNNFDFIVDGMLGTGLTSDLRGDYTHAVAYANEYPSPVYAVDIPTGIHADNGRIMGNAVNAVATYTFGVRKLGLSLNNGKKNAGEVIYCHLPFPNHLKKSISRFRIDPRDRFDPVAYRKGNPALHKYDGGITYILAGSEGLTGAAMMSCRSAWGAGVGATILITPQGMLTNYEGIMPQIIKKGVGKNSDLHFRPDHTETILEIISEKPGTLLLGPGIGRDEETVSFVQAFVQNIEHPLVIDADGLYALSEIGSLTRKSEPTVLTPHPGELTRLTEKDLHDDFERLLMAEDLATNKNVYVAAKGYPSVIATPSGKSYLTNYDTRIFARAGFGDVLSGKITAFMALGCSAERAVLAAMLNGKEKADAHLEHDPIEPLEPLDLV